MKFPFIWRKQSGTVPEKGSEAGKEYRPTDNEVRQKDNFRSALGMISFLMAETQSELEKAHILDMAIHALGASIAADGTSNFFQGKTVLHDKVYDIAYYAGELENAKLGKRELNLCKINTYTSPWKPIKFPVAARTILKIGFQQAESDVEGYYFRELDFATLGEGRHHSTIGRMEGQCIVSLEEISMLPYFAVVHTDGAYFYCGNKKKRVVDYRYALMFHLGKMLYSQYASAIKMIRELRWDHITAERERYCLQPNQPDSFWENKYVEACQERLTTSSEKMFWKNENMLCRDIIKRRNEEIRNLNQNLQVLEGEIQALKEEIQALQEALDRKDGNC